MRHAPHGACGLKQIPRIKRNTRTRSRPARGVWVETRLSGPTKTQLAVTPRTGRVG